MAPNPLAAMGASISLSAGMPLMYLAGFVFMAVVYTASKYMVLRHSLEPQSFFTESLLFLELSLIVRVLHSSYTLGFSLWPILLLVLFLAYLHSPKLKCRCIQKPQPLKSKTAYRKIIEQPSFSANFYGDLSIDYLTKYSIRAQRELSDIKQYFSICEDLPTEELFFQELCYVCNLTFEEVDLYIKIMEKRIGDI